VGRTGNARSTECHLHFEIRAGGEPIDPEPLLRRWDRYS
jgi:murein DD-endopeptidase MepM/ murein hydrolase activator NlpD